MQMEGSFQWSLYLLSIKSSHHWFWDASKFTITWLGAVIPNLFRRATIFLPSLYFFNTCRLLIACSLDIVPTIFLRKSSSSWYHFKWEYYWLWVASFQSSTEQYQYSSSGGGPISSSLDSLSIWWLLSLNSRLITLFLTSTFSVRMGEILSYFNCSGLLYSLGGSGTEWISYFGFYFCTM